MAADNNVRESIPPTHKALEEALSVAEEILREIESGDVPLVKSALKTGRLARLLNDFDMQQTMCFEVSGYPATLTKESWRLAVAAGRLYTQQPSATELGGERVYVESIEGIEAEVRAAEVVLANIVDTPKKTTDFFSPADSSRMAYRTVLLNASNRLASRRGLIHDYVTKRYYELHFSGVASDVFGRTRERVDRQIAELIPHAVQRFAAIYNNLQSDNSEDWSNAIHGCRRILMDVADAVFPPTDQVRTADVSGKSIQIRLQRDNYVNRIMAFVDDQQQSKRFSHVVGSQLAFLGDRLDAVAGAASKGTHTDIIAKAEADRYVVYTYLLVGDILSLNMP
jgi:hypothetical protein